MWKSILLIFVLATGLTVFAIDQIDDSYHWSLTYDDIANLQRKPLEKFSHGIIARIKCEMYKQDMKDAIVKIYRLEEIEHKYFVKCMKRDQRGQYIL